MTARKKACKTEKPKSKIKAAKRSSSDSLKEIHDREYEEWEQIRNAWQQRCIDGAMMNSLKQKINATASFLISLDRRDEHAANPKYRGLMFDPVTGYETIEHKAWCSVANDVRLAQHQLLRIALDGMLNVIKDGNGEQARYLTSSLISLLVETIQTIKMLALDEKKQKLLRDSAETLIEFPSLLSVFKKENTHFERLVMDELRLGLKLPFAVDPRKTYTPYTLLAMEIVSCIDFERRYAWPKRYGREMNSVYLKIVPDLHKLDFCKANAAAWEKLIEFHLDYFQSPATKQEKTAFAFALEEHFLGRKAHDKALFQETKDPEGNVISWSRPGWFDTLCPWGIITEIPEFKVLLESRRDKLIKNQNALYSRVKHKVIDAAMSLLPEKTVPD